MLLVYNAFTLILLPVSIHGLVGQFLVVGFGAVLLSYIGLRTFEPPRLPE